MPAQPAEPTSPAPHEAQGTEPPDLAALLDGQAYVLPLLDDDEICYAIFDDQGRPLAVAPSRDLAFIAIRQHDLEPVDAH